MTREQAGGEILATINRCSAAGLGELAAGDAAMMIALGYAIGFLGEAAVADKLEDLAGALRRNQSDRIRADAMLAASLARRRKN